MERDPVVLRHRAGQKYISIHTLRMERDAPPDF